MLNHDGVPNASSSLLYPATSGCPSSGIGLHMSDRPLNRIWQTYESLRSCWSSYFSFANCSTILFPSSRFTSSAVSETALCTSSIAPVYTPISQTQLSNPLGLYKNNRPTVSRRDICKGSLVRRRGWGCFGCQYAINRWSFEGIWLPVLVSYSILNCY